MIARTFVLMMHPGAVVKRWLIAVVIMLAFMGCSETPEQRAQRIGLECVAVVGRAAQIVERDASTRRNMISECIFERGKGSSR